MARLFRLSFVCTFALCLLTRADNSNAQVPPFNTDNVLNLLRTKSVQSELEIVDSQTTEINTLYGTANAKFGFYAREARTLPENERKAAFAKLKREIADLEQNAINVLLPHQRERLRQLKWQQLAKSSQPSAGLLHEAVIAELKLSNEQTQAIQEKARELEIKLKAKLEELAKQIAVAKEQTRSEMLMALTPEQRKQYDAMFGKPFDPQSTK